MIFKCNNCGGNVVYNPKKSAMVCPHCESEESQQKMAVENMMQCVNCGAPLEATEYASAMKCPNCGNYHVFEERVTGEYQPHLILPFKISKEDAVAALKNEFKKRVFTPAGFLSHASVEKMEGTYVPFFLYDYFADANYRARGTKVRSWTSGKYKYTETSFYEIEREMDIEFNRIPVDASLAMNNSIMDLMEPYNYQALEAFEEKYMSGFNGEVYSDTRDVLSERAQNKAKRDSETLLRESVTGYSTLTNEVKNVYLKETKCEYALLPVWVYDFSYQGETYRFHINGQTGKVIGQTPVAYKKVFGYTATVFGLCIAACSMIRLLMMFTL